MIRRFLLPIVILIVFAGCGIPRDPNETLKKTSGGTLRVGVVESEPWVKRTNDEPAGVEVELVREFARELNARPEWIWGNEEDLIEALKRFELDIVIGGIKESSPLSKEVAFTNPYFTNRIVVGTPSSMPPAERIENVRVAVKKGDAIAAKLEEKDAVPVRVENPFQTNNLAAAADWELENHGYALSDIELGKEKHVIAVPPGENNFLVRLDNFLFVRRSKIKEMLSREAQEK